MALRWIYCVICSVLILKRTFGAEDIWHSYQFGSGHGNREELVITKVEAVDSFKTDRNVLSWRTLSFKHKSYGLGLTENGVIALQASLDDTDSGNIVTNSSHIEMNGTIIDAFLFENWNSTMYTNDIIAVIAMKNRTTNDVELKGFKFTDENQLICGWSQSWKKNVTHINVFKINTKWHILICNDRYENYTTADLYEFVLGNNPDFWLTQKINLKSPTRTSTVTAFGLDTYLTIPQTDHILVFKYETNHFVPAWNLTAGNVTYTKSFKIGFHAFLAIDGLNAGVYKFTEAGLQQQEIRDANLDGIDYWISIPVRTYRDDEILIAERFLDHGSHGSFDVQVVLYNEGRFSVHEEMECWYYGEMVHGMNCIVDEEKNSVGIKGSAFLVFGDVLGILIPRNHTSSGLFRIQVELKEVESPLQKQIKVLNSFRKKLELKIQERKEKLENLKVSLKNSIKSHEENVISAPWKINTLAAPLLKQTDDAVFHIPATSHIQNLFDRITNIRKSISDLGADLRKVPPLESRGEFKTLIVKGPVEVRGASAVETVEAVDFNDGFNFGDVVGVGDGGLVRGRKVFSNVVVEELFVDNVDGIKAEEFLFEGQDSVEVNGDVVFERNLTVSGNVETGNINDGDLLKDLVTIGTKYEGQLAFENVIARESLQVETANKFPIHDNYLNAISGNIKAGNIEEEEFDILYIPGNITVETVNGENFNELLHSLCLKNLRNEIPGETTVIGSVNALQSEIGSLNGLDFSSEYVFANGNKFPRITGEKVFRNEVRMKELITRGTVNGINTENIITLSEDQKLFGKLTFDKLKVVGELNVTGTVNFGISKAATNAALQQTDTITANCNFKHLEIEGALKIGSNFNGTDFESALSDVIYKTEPEAEITSVKEFPSGFKTPNLNAISNSINDIPLSGFVDKNSDGVLEIGSLNGNVTFVNLNLGGNFGGVDIKKLSEESVRISGEQFTAADLIFENFITASDLDIRETVNGLGLNDFLSNDPERVVEYENIEVENLLIEGDLNASILDFDIGDFDEKRLSLSREQTVSGDAVFHNSNIENFIPATINGIAFEKLFGVDSYAEEIKELLENGNVTIKEMIVEDGLNISSINHVPMKEILKTCVWTDEKEHRLSLKFKGDVEFNSLQVETLNDVNFTDFAENSVFKNQTDVTFTSTKLFSNGVEVSNYINALSINEIPVENILRKGGEQSVKSKIWIEGDVWILDNFKLDKLNNVTFDDVNTIFQVVDEDTYRILGHVDFDRISYVNNLTLTSNINQEPIGDFLSGLINTNKNTNLTAAIKFEKPVTISGNLAAEKGVNGIDINGIKENIVFLTQDASIDGFVVFEEDVAASEIVEIEKDLDGPSVMGVDLRQWMKDSVFINVGKIPGMLHFEEAVVENNIMVNLMNNVDVHLLVPLRLDQEIPMEFTFGELSSFKDITVENVVNGRKLFDEYHNSVLSGKIQEITSDVIFNANTLVRSKLQLSAPLNGHDVSRMVTLDGNQELSSSFHFTNSTAIKGNLFIRGNINGLNMSDWINSSLKKFSPYAQTVTEPWDVNGRLIFGSNVIGNGSISGLNLRDVADKVEEMRLFKKHVELELINQFKIICKDINGIVAAAKSQIFLFEYLDHHQILDFKYGISNIHHYKYQDFHYMLTTDNTSCFSELFFWNKTMFSHIKRIETGKIVQMVTVRDGDLVFLVSRHNSDRDCNFAGANVWKVSIDKIQILYAIDDCTLLQESVVPGTFYTVDEDGVSEYRLITAAETNVHKVRRWRLNTANVAFIPHGLNYGLSLRNGKNVIRLSRDESVSEQDLGFNYNTVIDGKITWTKNHFLPGKNDGEMLAMNVGHPRRTPLVAVSTLEKKTRRNRLKKVDYINIYDDLKNGKVFNKILANEPSSLLSLEFGNNGETLLVFLENRERLNVYEYKGIEGFKRRISVKVRGSKLVHFFLPFGENGKGRSFIGVINENRLTLLQAVMEGDQIVDENLQCTL